MKEDKEYRCESCDTMTVSMELEWDKISTRDEEELFAVYSCNRCGGTLSLETDRKSNHKDYGDTIYVEGGYNEAFKCFGCGDIHSVRYTSMWKNKDGIYGHEKDVEGEEGWKEGTLFECMRCHGTAWWDIEKAAWKKQEGKSIMTFHG